MKKVISLFLSLMMLLSMTAGLDLSAYAADELPSSGSCGANVTYTFNSSTGLLTISGTGPMKDYSNDNRGPFYQNSAIKTVVINNGVTSISNEAFFDCRRLTSISIPNSVKSIGDAAFYDCFRLTSISIPNSVTSIDEQAFTDCSGLTSIKVNEGNTVYDSRDNCNAIIKTASNTLICGCKNTMIPDSVTSIGSFAFSGCRGLTSITIPNRVKSIGDLAFEDCSGLTSINIPNSVTSIGSNAFSHCSGLTSVTIGNSVTSIGYAAFYECRGLTSITIPNSVKSIGYSAFSNCSGLTSVTIGNSVTSIGERAFYQCTGLTGITIPNSVTSIGNSAFYQCYGLTSITIPNSVTSIGYEAFYGCSGLTSITIPDSVKSIGFYAFYGCSGLTSITIPDSVTSISNGVFSNCRGLRSITIPDSVTSIGACTFSGCSSLTSITIPDSVTSIGDNAFRDCSGLTSITIPDSVTSIYESTFFNCTSLKCIEFSDSVTSIGKYAFYSCSSLTDVYFTGTEEEWENISIGSGNASLTNATIHYNPGESEEDLSNQWGFRNAAETITRRQYYENLFPKAQAWLFKQGNITLGEKGWCHGMSLSAALLYHNANAWVDTDDLQSITTARRTKIKKKTKYVDTLYDLMAYGVLYQASKACTKAEKENTDCGDLIDAVKHYGEDRVLIKLSCKYGHHTVLAHSVKKISDTRWDIAVYDPNMPHEYNHLKIIKIDEGKYVYAMYFCTYKDEDIYFDQGLSYFVVNRKGEFYDFLTEGKKVSSSVFHKMITRSSYGLAENDQLTRFSFSGVVVDENGCPVEPSEDEDYLYYLNEDAEATNQISFENKDENAYQSISMATEENAYSFNVRSDATIDYSLGDTKISSIEISGTDKAEVNYAAVIDDRLVNFDFSGDCENESVTINNADTVIEIDGLDDGAVVTVSSEDGLTETVTKTLDGGSAKIDIVDDAIELQTDNTGDGNYENTEIIGKVCTHSFDDGVITKAATCTGKGEKVYTCAACGETKIEPIKEKGHKIVNDKAVAPTFVKAGKTAGTHCSVCKKVLKKQTAVAKLGAPSVAKLAKGKKSFTASWKAVTRVDGYEVQYSLKKNMKSSKTSVVKGAKAAKLTVKKLKKKKKYYVRIRAYKTIGRKKQYSKWSAIKSVKTK